jgi:hypothetical protein
MTHEICAAYCAEYNLTAADDYCGVEYGEQCWGGKLASRAQKLNESACSEMPCVGNPQQQCGGPYKIQVSI